MDAIKNWYVSLETSEQRMVLIAAAFFSAFILVFAILKPLNTAVSQLEKQVASKQRNVAWMRSQLPLIKQNASRAQGNQSNLPLSRVVTQSTSQFGLSVSRVQEKGSDEIQVWLENANFDKFLRWAAVLENRYQVQIFDVNIRGRERNGITSINLKLTKN